MKWITLFGWVLAALFAPARGSEPIPVDGAATPEETLSARKFAERYMHQVYRTPRYLYIREPAVDDAGLAPLRYLTKVEHLELVGLPITDRGLSHLAALSELRSLEIVGNRPSHGDYESDTAIHTEITGTGFKYLVDLDKLKHLFLRGLPLKSNVLSELSELDSLEVLNVHDIESHAGLHLESAGITDQTLAELRDLRHLKRVSFATYREGATCAGFRDWKSAASIEHLTLSGFHVSEAGWGAISEFTNR